MDISSTQLAQSSIIGQVGGGLSSAVGGYYGAQSQQSALDFQSRISGVNAGIASTNADTLLTIGNANADAIQSVGDYNSQMAELGAQSALFSGRNQVTQQTMRAGQVMGAQRAAIAANGIDLGQGSAADVQASTRMVKAIDTRAIEYNAMSQALGYRQQGMNAQLQASVQAMNTRSNAAMSALNQRSQAIGDSATSGLQAASAAGISPLSSAAGSLMTSAGKVASSWYQYSQQNYGAGNTAEPVGDPIYGLYQLNNGWK